MVLLVSIHPLTQCCIEGCTEAEVAEEIVQNLLDPNCSRANGEFFARIGLQGNEIFCQNLAYHIVNPDSKIVRTRNSPSGTIVTVKGPIQVPYKGTDPTIESVWLVKGTIAEFMSAGLA